jgi:hypothetical protein
MKEETKEVTYNEYKEEQMRRNRWKGGERRNKEREDNYEYDDTLIG